MSYGPQPDDDRAMAVVIWMFLAMCIAGVTGMTIFTLW